VPITPTYPGVYVEELKSGVHPITGVATSITAFVGFAPRGPVDEPTTVQSFLEYARVFGGLWLRSTMSYAVQQFFQNGGSQALIVRAIDPAAVPSRSSYGSGNRKLRLQAASAGVWGDKLLMRIDADTEDSTRLFNLSVKDTGTGVVEVLRNLAPGAALRATLLARSNLVRLDGGAPTTVPAPHDDVAAGDDPFDPDPSKSGQYSRFSLGSDGAQDARSVVPGADNGKGMYALARADLFNLLVIPPVLPASDPGAERVLRADLKGRAAAFAQKHRALFLVDPDPDWDEPSDLLTTTPPTPSPLDTYTTSIDSDRKRNAALYFPYLRAPDPLQGGAVMDYPPAGATAGVMARTDTERGVWKAPAGLEAGLSGVQELTAKLTDGENGLLNPVAVNCLRTFPASGHVVWGARTLAGADKLTSEWKYVPVRRTALYLEESLYRSLQWVVFEPNDEPLWAQIRLNVGAFMQDLFRKGAFQGKTPREAYLVKCDAETTTQTDINNGVVNVIVGFAPLKPAEFVIVQIQQLAGQIES
jgi:phage tail sheath protein FI